MSTGFAATLPERGIREFPENIVWEFDDVEAVGLAGVGTHDRGAARVGYDRDAIAARHGLCGEQRRYVKEFGHRVGTDHARLLKQSVDCDIRGGDERARVRRCRARAGRRATALDRDDRLARAHAPRDPGESAWIPERLEVQQDHIGKGVLLPVVEQVVAGNIGLVADRHERRDPQTEPSGGLDHRDSQPAALREEADVPRRRRMGGKGGVEVHVRCRVEHPEAVGTDEPHTGIAADREQFALPSGAFGAGLGEPSRDHQERVNACRSALARNLVDGDSGNHDYRELDRLGNVTDRRVRLDGLGSCGPGD